MTAIVAGQGLGLVNTSLGLLGGQGQLGTAKQGRFGESVYVNASTGNLVVQQQDEWLVGMGPDAAILRTYNSQATSDGDNNDNWRLGLSRKVYGLGGGAGTNTAGSTVKRVGEDGVESIYAYDPASTLYVNKDGGGSFDTLRWTGSVWSWVDGDTQVIETYEVANPPLASEFRLKSVADSDGKTLTLSYNAAGLINRIADASNEYVQIEYGGASGKNILAISTWHTDTGTGVSTQLFKRVSYEYDTNAPNRLIKVTVDLTPSNTGDASVYVTDYTYEGTSNRLKTLVDTGGSGNKLEFGYDQTSFKLISVKEYLSSTDIRETKFNHDTAGTTRITDPLGQVTELVYDTSSAVYKGQLRAIKTPPVGGKTQTTTFDYDVNGNLSTIKDARDNVVTYAYDVNGNRKYERDAQGNVVERVFGAANQLLSETLYTGLDPDGDGPQLPSGGLSTRYAYDAKMHLRFSVSADGRVTEHAYDPVNGQRTVTLQYSKILYTGTDFSESALIAWAGGQRSTALRTDYAYDFRGQIKTQTTYARVDANGIGITSDNTHSVIEYVYDPSGNLLQKIDGRGEELANRDTDWAKTERVRLGKSQLAASLSVQDKADLRARYTTAYSYDGLNRLETQTDAASGGKTITQYTDLSLSTKVTLLNGLITTSVYDKAGRLLSIERSGGDTSVSGTTRYVYDLLGRLTKVSAPSGVAGTTLDSYTFYDEASRKVAEIDPEGRLTEYRYNLNNQLAGTIQYATKVSAAKSALDAWASDPRTAGITLAALHPAEPQKDDRRSWNIYDKAGRLLRTILSQGTELEAGDTGAVTEYRYDGAGRLTDIIRRGLTVSWVNMEAIRADGVELSVSDGKIYANGSVIFNPGFSDLTPEQDRRTRSFYSNDGLLSGQLDGEGYYTQRFYDAAGRLSKTTRYAKAMVGTLADGNVPPTVINAGATPPTSAYVVQQLVSESEGGADQATWYWYNNRGQLTGVRDAQDYYTEYRYDVAGNKSAEIRYANAIAVYNNSQPVAIAALVDSGGYDYVLAAANDRKTFYSYDADNRLVGEDSQPIGLVTTYEYDNVGNLLKSIKAPKVPSASLPALTTSREYDKLGRIVREMGGEGSKALAAASTPEQKAAVWAQYGQQHFYNEADQRVATIESDGLGGTGNKTLFYYDRNGRITHSINALGEIVEYTYNALGQQVQERHLAARYAGALGSLDGGLNAKLGVLISNLRDDRFDSVTASKYNRNGQAASTTDAENNTFTLSYNAFGEVRLKNLLTSAGWRRQAMFYDRRGLRVAETDGTSTTAPSRTTKTRYDAFGRVSRMTDARDIDTLFYRDKLGRVIEAFDRGSSTLKQRTVYDAFDRVVTRYDQSGQPTTYTYQDASRKLTVAVEGLSTVTESDAQGQVVTVTDAKGTVTRYEYNADGNLLKETLVSQTGTTLKSNSVSYDKAGRVAYTVDERAAYKFVEYDKVGRVIKSTDFRDGKALSTDYFLDAKGQAVWSRDANGVWTQTEFDRKGQVKAIVVDPQSIPSTASTNLSMALIANPAPGGALSLRTEFTYDAEGRQLTVTEGAGSLTTTPRTTQYVYDVMGRRIEEIVDPSGIRLKTTYAYDRNDNVVTKTVAPDTATSYATRYVYDASNRLQYSVDALGITKQTAYDVNGRVSRITAYANRIMLADLPVLPAALTKNDVDSALVSDSGLDHAERNVYDKNGRLSWRVDASGYATQYEYDQVGNIVATTRYAKPVVLAAGSVSDDAVTFTAPTVTLDPANDQLEQFVYDGANRVICKVDARGHAVFTGYSADGREITETHLAGDVKYPANQSRLAVNVAPKMVSQLPSPISEPVVLAGDVRDYQTKRLLDQAGRVVSFKDGEGYYQDTSYDNMGRVKSIKTTTHTVDVNGDDVVTVLSTTRYGFDAAGRLLDTTDAEGAITRNQYDDAGRRVAVIRALGSTADESTTRYVYDRAGRLTDEIRAYGKPEQSTTRYELDGLGQRVAIIDPRGIEAAEGLSAWAVAERQRLLSTTSTAPLDRSSPAYKTVVDAYTTRQTFNAQGLMTSSTDPLLGVTRTLYNAFGQAVKVTDPKGNAGYFYFDQRDQAAWQIDPEGYVTQTKFDGFGNAESIVKYAGRIQGAPVTYLQPRAFATKEEATAASCVVYVLTSAQDATTKIEHDKLNRQTKITDAQDFVELMAYDGLGNKTSYTQKSSTAASSGPGGVYIYTYDKNGRVITETLPEKVFQRDPVTGEALTGSAKVAVINRYAYDARGNRIKAIEAENLYEQRITEFKYDKLDRLVEQTGQPIKTYVAGGVEQAGQIPKETRKYDKRGNLIEVVAADNGRTLTYYDLLDRKVAEVTPTGTLSEWTYTAHDETTTLRVYEDLLTPSGLVAGGTPPSPVQADRYRETVFSYDRNGRLQDTTVKGVMIGDVSALTGNYEVRLQDLVVKKGYDRNGNVVSETDARGNTTWHYFDKVGNEVARVDARRYLTYWERDGSGAALKEVKAATRLPDSTVVNADTTLGALKTAVGTSDDDRVVDYVMDKVGRVKTQTVSNVVATTRSEATGQLSTSKQPAVTTFTYNGLGLVTERKEALSADILLWSYDLQGRETRRQGAEFKDYLGNSVRQTTDTEYDGLGSTTRAIERASLISETGARITRYSYLAGVLTSQTSAENEVSYFKHDVMGRTTARILTRKDAAGVSSTDITTYTYDASGREKRTDVYSLNGVNSFFQAGVGYKALRSDEAVYNAFGEVEQKSTNGAQQEFAQFDKAGRAVKSNAGNGVTKAYVFDANGNVTQTLESTGVDLKSLSMAQILARNDLLRTISVFDERNQVVDTYQQKEAQALATSSVQGWLNTQMAEGNNDAIISVTGASSAPAFASVVGLAERGTSVSDKAEVISASGIALKTTYGPSYSFPAYSAIASPPVTFHIPDTTVLGDGSVIITATSLRPDIMRPGTPPMLEYAGLVYPVPDMPGTYGGFTDRTDVTYKMRTILAAGADQLTLNNFGAYVIKDGSLDCELRIQKVVGNSMVDLMSPISVSFVDGPTAKVTFSGINPGYPLLTLQNEAATTDRVVMSYRVKGGSDAWTVRTLAKGKLDAAGLPQFGFLASPSSAPANVYEMKYVALSAAGDILNSEEGTMTVTASEVLLSQTPRPVGGGGQAFASVGVNGQRMLNVTEQGTNTASAVWSITPQSGGPATVVNVGAALVDGVAVPGWFQLARDQVPQLGSGSFNYTLTGFGADGTTITTQVGGTFSIGASDFGSTISLASLQGPAAGVMARGAFASQVMVGPVTGAPIRTAFPAQASGSFAHSAYSAIGGLQTTLSIPDTRGLGSGDVYIYMEESNPKTIFLNAQGWGQETGKSPRKVSYYDADYNRIEDPNTFEPYEYGAENNGRKLLAKVSGGLAAEKTIKLGAYVLAGGTLQGNIRIYKVDSSQREVQIASAIAVTFTDGATPSVALVSQNTAFLQVLNQPAGTAQLVMAYRVKNSGSAWTVKSLDKGVSDGNGVAQFTLSSFNTLTLGTTYEMKYVALSGAGDVLNSAEGNLKFGASGIVLTQTPRAIGGGGQIFASQDATGKQALNVTEQGTNALSGKWILTPVAGGASTTLPATFASINGASVPGWFQLRADSIAGLTGTDYRYTLVCYGADGLTVTSQVSGTFSKVGATFGSTLTLVKDNGPSAGIVSMGTFRTGSVGFVSAVTGTPMRTLFPGRSTTHGEYQAYSAIGGWSATIPIPDTSAMGPGEVSAKLETIDPKVIYPLNMGNETAGKTPSYGEDPATGDYTDTSRYQYLSFAMSPQSRTRSLGSTAVTSSSTLTVTLGAYLLTGGTLNSRLRVYKTLADGSQIELCSPVSVTFVDGPSPTVNIGAVKPGEILLALQNQPVGATQAAMMYRLKDSNAPWAVKLLNKGTVDALGSRSFWLSSMDAGLVVGTYEMKYVSMTDAGEVLNSEEGTLQVSSTDIVATQTPRPRGAGGQVFVDTEGYVNFIEQGPNASQATLSFQVQSGGQAVSIPQFTAKPAVVNGVTIPGWFRFRLDDLSPAPGSTYNYVLESRTADGRTIANLVEGSFTPGAASAFTPPKVLSSYQRVFFQNLPLTATSGRVYYTARTPNAVVQQATMQASGQGTLVWNASGLLPQTYDVRYEAYDAQSRLVSSGAQSLSMGDPTGQAKSALGDNPALAMPSSLFTLVGATNTLQSTRRTNAYNAFGEVEEQFDTLKRNTSYRYNVLGKLVKQESPTTDVVGSNGGSTRKRPTTLFYYDLQGRQIAVQDANQLINAQQWTAATASGEAKVAVEYHADQGVLYKRYDVFGDLVETTNENWDGQAGSKPYFTTKYQYDGDHRLTKVTRPLRKGSTTYTVAGYDRYVYDSAGNRIAHYTTSTGTAELPADRSYYDALGRVTSTVSAADRTMSYLYEDGVTVSGLAGQAVIGQRVTTTNGNDTNNKLVDEKDLFGHVTKHIDLGGHVYSYNYSAAGWLMAQTNSAGQNIIYEYYGNGHVKKMSDLVQTTYSMYEYDSEGNKTLESYATWFDKNVYQRASIVYDELNRIKTITDPQYTLTYSYDAVGNRRHLVSAVKDRAGTNQDFWYAYDSMNRFSITMGTLTGVAGAAGTTITAGGLNGAGVHLTYDKTGQRVQSDNVRDGHSEKYIYTTDGFLDTIKLTNATKYVAPTASSQNGVSPVDADYWISATRDSDLMGRVGTYKEYVAGGGAVSNTHTYEYDFDSKTKLDKSQRSGGGGITLTTTTTYDMYKDGTLISTSAKSESTAAGASTTVLDTLYGYEWWESAKQSTIKIRPFNSATPGWRSGLSKLVYDVNGNLAQAVDAGGDGTMDTTDDRRLIYTNNAQGLVLFRTETASGVEPKKQTYYYVNGVRVGETGNDAADSTVDYAQALANSAKEALPGQSGSTQSGLSYQYASARPTNFDQNYQPINAGYPAFTSNGYTANAGDTLEGIARGVWGDATLWYLIAEANGLIAGASTALTAGQSLVIPNKVTNVHNTSSTFKVYNPGEAMGNVSPTLPEAPPPPPPPPPKNGCGGVGMVLMVVVAVVATIFTAGAALAVLGPGLAATTSFMAAGMGALAGSFGAASVAVGLASVAIGGAVGSMASQLVGMATGDVKEFSWSGVARGAITAAATAGAGAMLNAVASGSELASQLGVVMKAGQATGPVATVARAVMGSFLGQQVSRAAGYQKGKFSWTSVAVSAVSSAASYGLQSSMGNWGDGLLTETGGGVMRGAVSGIAGGWASSIARHEKPDWGGIAVSAFGSALGDAVVGSIRQADANKQPPGAVFNWDDADMDGEAHVDRNAFTRDRQARAAAQDANTPDWTRPKVPTAAEPAGDEPFDFRRESLRANARSAAEEQARSDFRRSEITAENAAAKPKDIARQSAAKAEAQSRSAQASTAMQQAQSCSSVAACKEMSTQFARQAETFGKAAGYFKDRGDLATSNQYMKLAIDAGLASGAASDVVRAATPKANYGAATASIPSSPFSPGWNTGTYSAGLPASNPPGISGNYGVGIYYGVGIEFEVGLANNSITDVKMGLGVGYGGHFKADSGFVTGPAGGAKFDFYQRGDQQNAGDFRIGSTAGLAASYGPVGAEYFESIGGYSNANGKRDWYSEGKGSVAIAPTPLKIGLEAKWNLLEFSYKRQGQ